MFYLCHLRYEIGSFNQLRWRISAGNDNVQSRLRGANRAKFFHNFVQRQHLVSEHINQFVKDQHVLIA